VGEDERHRLDGRLAGGVAGVGRQDPTEQGGREVDDAPARPEAAGHLLVDHERAADIRAEHPVEDGEVDKGCKRHHGLRR
jgi:hypothetical protein